MADTPTEVTKQDIIAVFRELPSKADLRELFEEGKPSVFEQPEEAGPYLLAVAKSTIQAR